MTGLCFFFVEMEGRRVGRFDDEPAARQLFQAAVERVKTRKWHIQIYARLAVIQALKDLVMAAPVPIVFDHFGGAQASLGVGQLSFDALLDLVQKGKAYVKISAHYRSSTQATDYPDAAPLAKALIAANPGRVLWALTGHIQTRQRWRAAKLPTSLPV